MFVLGHLGFGGTISARWVSPQNLYWVFLGCLLPDLIDKPLYYAASFLTGLQGKNLGLISGTRTFAHTFIALGLIIFFSRKNKFLYAVMIGYTTHLIFDPLSDCFNAWLQNDPHPLESLNIQSATVKGLLFPFLGFQFPEYPFHNAQEHLGSIQKTGLLLTEAIGGCLLYRLILNRRNLLRQKKELRQGSS